VCVWCWLSLACLSGQSEPVLELLLLNAGRRYSPATHQVQSSQLWRQFWLVSGD